MADGRLIFDTKLDSSGFEKGIAGLGKISKAGFSLMKNTVLAAGAAVTVFSAYSIKAGSDFDAAMSNVEAISGATGAQLESLRDKAKQMGADTVFSATESAEAFGYMAQAGWDTEQMLGGIEGVMFMAAASGETLALSAETVTDTLNAFGESAGEATRLADILAATAAGSSTNVGLMAETFKYAAPLAGTLGYSMEDTALAIGLMANAGIKGSQAGTALRSAFTRMANPTKTAAAEMEALGISITDAYGEMKPLNQLIPELKESFAGLTEEQQAQAAANIFGQNAMSGMLAIINAGEDDYNDLADAIYNSKGAAEEMAAIKLDNLQGDITLLKSAVEGLGIAFYEHMDSGLREVVQTATGYIDTLSNAIKENGLSGAVAALGEIVADITVRIAEAAPQMIEAAAGLIRAFITGISDNKELIIESVTEAMTALLLAAMEIIPEMLALGMDIILGLVTGIVGNLDTLVPAATDMILTIVDTLIDSLDTLIPAGVEIIITIMQALIDNLDKILDATLQIVDTLIDALIDNLPLIFEMGMELILKLVQGIIQRLPDVVLSVIELIRTFLRTVTSNLPQILSMGGKIIGDLLKGMISVIPALIAGTGTIVKSVLSAFKSGFLAVPGIGIDMVKGLWNGIASAKDWIISKIGGWTSSVVGAMKSFFGIRSPSTVFRDEVGKWLPMGISEGFEDELPDAERSMLKQLSGWGKMFESRVNFQAGGLSLEMAGASSTVHSVHENKVLAEISDKTGDLYATLEVEGRPFAKATAVYTSEEQALINKRRRAW